MTKFNNNIPLCIDLDGTLINTDMLYELIFRLVKNSFFCMFLVPWVLITKGRAGLKSWLVGLVSFDPAVLPYNQHFLKWLQEQRASGRRLILCTASDQVVAVKIAQYLGIFEEIIASNGVVNLAGKNKAEVLLQKFGHKGFDYAGDSKVDVVVWRYSRNAIVVNASDALLVKVNSFAEIEKVFNKTKSNIKTWTKVLRMHQWLKNLLIFIPLLAAHRLADSEAWVSLLLAFFAFSLCASSVYITNDLLDLESDRKHPRKCMRPFASGTVSIWKGAVLVPSLIALSLIIGNNVGNSFPEWLIIYFLITSAYSIKVKQLVIVDCMTLGILYTLRIVAGAAAINGSMSFWLLSFSLFLFISLAFIKRFAELKTLMANSEKIAHGRGYITDDALLIQMLGITSGFMSVLVLALYLNSPDVQRLYAQPEWVWGDVPVMLFWISWMWLRADRGEMDDDPMLFAVKDNVSLLAGGFFAFFMLLGVIHI